ncbi:6070_t:CDS:1, partial [Dentiscutata heterogama]
ELEESYKISESNQNILELTKVSSNEQEPKDNEETSDNNQKNLKEKEYTFKED